MPYARYVTEGYPGQWEADVVLSDGGTAHLRPIRSEDGDLLRVFYARLSPESIYYRFFSPRPYLTDREVEHFTGVDYDRRVALIATIAGEMVAVVRYDMLNDRPETAEVAFLVEDAHQGRDIGTARDYEVFATLRVLAVRIAIRRFRNQPPQIRGALGTSRRQVAAGPQEQPTASRDHLGRGTVLQGHVAAAVDQEERHRQTIHELRQAFPRQPVADDLVPYSGRPLQVRQQVV